MPELAQIVDSFFHNNNESVTFDVEVANGQIQWTFHSAAPGFDDMIISLCFVCHLDSMNDFAQFNNIPFMIERKPDGGYNLFRIEGGAAKPS